MIKFNELKDLSKSFILAFNNANDQPISLDSFFEDSPADEVREEMQKYFHSFDARKQTLTGGEIIDFNEKCGFTKEYKDIICNS